MGLNKYKMGQLIEPIFETNNLNLFGPDDVMGMTITKEVIPTKADLTNTNLSEFIVVHNGDFIFNPRTHGKKIGFGYNNTGKPFIISWNNIAFRIKPNMAGIILPDYLFLHFNRGEWDREACFQSWGSSTEVFSWESLSDMKIVLPQLSVQQKYVNIYNALLKNQQCYERGLEDLKMVCDGYLDRLRSSLPLQRIGDFIEQSYETNEDAKYGLDDVRGVSIEKKFIDTKADMQGVNLSPYLIVRPDDFAYVTVTSRNGGKISLAYNDSSSTFICSSSYIVFRCRNSLLPQYLRMYFERSEFNRYARFNSWGSARETFDYSEMEDVRIPIPSVEIQKSIADIFLVYSKRKNMNDELKTKLRNICPILIKGSIEEAQKES